MTIHDRNKTTNFYAFILIAAAVLLFPYHARAEIVSSSQYGYALDLPASFSLADKQSDGKAFLFRHTILPVQLAVKIYDNGEYGTAADALAAVYGKLNAKGDVTPVTWRNADGVLSTFTLQLPGDDQVYKGWSFAVLMPRNKAALVLLCYAPEEKENDCEQFILSVLDSLMIDRGSFFEPGPVTAFAFPGKGDEQITIQIGDRKIPTVIDAEDSEAENFVIEREYAVLTLYANRTDWKEAWQRYYRMIYRDSYARLKRPAFDLYNALQQETEKKSGEDPFPAVTEQLLAWTQNFPFVRDSNTADFTPLTDVLQGKPSDCDSRSLLLCTLLAINGARTELFISHEYSHAVFGIASDRPGAKITTDGVSFLLGETTARVALGRIAQNMNDTAKWIPVKLY
ncbi:MAG: hypothetical protein LKF96_04075 [Treponema sp.]|jgi:hypothetical protein|nr:hypothetical protein [Treponema sp.]